MATRREGQPVARVGDQGEGGEGVADLGAVTEPERAGDVHRDAGGHERLLDAGGELVDAHEHAQLPTAGAPASRWARAHAAIRCASSSSSSASSTAIGSPAGPVVHRRLSSRPRLAAMSALAAVRIVAVER